MPAHGGLREPEHLAELTDREGVPLQHQEQAAPGEVGKGAETVEDGRHYRYILSAG